MIVAFKLAGFFAAHAIWSVSDQEEGTTPVLAYTTEGGERKMDRFVSGDAATSVKIGRERLESNVSDANDAVLVYDGRIPVGDEKLDAVIVEIRAYFSPDSKAAMAVPYTPKSSGKFRVHKPKLVEWSECEDFDLDAAIEAFFEGVAEHEKGAKVWNDALDESK